MQTKMLQAADKLLFVKALYDYASRAVNVKVKALYAEKTGMSVRTFSDKMNRNQTFKGFELDVIEKLYQAELGNEIFEEQLFNFISIQSDGDHRTVEAAKDREIKKLAEINNELLTSNLLV